MNIVNVALRIYSAFLVLIMLTSCDTLDETKGSFFDRLFRDEAPTENNHPKLSELEYFQKAGRFYLEGLFHRGLITAEVGLSYFPNSNRLDLLKQRLEKVIEDEKEFFKVENPPPQQQPNQDQQDQNQDEQNQEDKQNQEDQQDQQNEDQQGNKSQQNTQSDGGASSSEAQGTSSNQSQSEASPSSNSESNDQSGGEEQSQGENSDSHSANEEGVSSQGNGTSSVSPLSEGGQLSSGDALSNTSEYLSEGAEGDSLTQEQFDSLQVEYIEKEAANQFLEQFKDQEGKVKYQKYRRSPNHRKDW